MAVNCVRLDKFETIHENRFWNSLKDHLQKHYSKSEDEIFLIGNIIIEGKQIDALCIKSDALIAIDFKDYGGELKVSENAPWVIDGVQINSGGKNPFQQLYAHKFAILNALESKLPKGFDNWINLGHINALVLFQQPIKYDSTRIQYDLSHPVSKWFNICDFDHVVQTLDEIVSSSTLIKGKNRDDLLDALGVLHLTQKNGDTAGEDIEIDSPENTLGVGQSPINGLEENTFAHFYYTQAKRLKKIDFLIIGQDPYPSKPNGVAFCKDWGYELFQEDCAGGVVLNSLGLNREMAKAAGLKNPKEIFLFLLNEKGICFLNISNKRFSDLAYDQVDSSLRETRDFNLPFVEKAKRIILLGKSKTQKYFSQYYPEFSPDHIFIHPSLVAKEADEEEWLGVWGGNTLEKIVFGES